ncbi:glycoside hydrolase family 15 protein [Microbacterium rhizomatis]|uniref:Glycoside hydrolase family 15 protein n=1 Tax=Microbacterium rhizomatis TaxID=1631477 RepID=A0A5J5J1L2_9MICO|nr:glycoside hydrolase family 15 protein [Microbacterium rhizomatis]KAA9108365.1 glycoside hydrolase family 15 protein [Microbacterium rhizomatis]
MASPIEDYAILSDCHTAALVSREGSIDWLCLPRYDSASTFGALLGTEDHGRWMLRPTDPDAATTRRYDGDGFVLLTRWETATGVAEVADVMPYGDRRADVIRRIRGISGSVEFIQDLRVRFDYARAMPWMRQVGTDDAPALVATAGPDALVFRGAPLHAADHSHAGTVTVAEGETVDLTMTWFPSHRAVPDAVDVDAALASTATWWASWGDGIRHHGPHHAEVVRSLLVLRALTHEDTGGILAAATTSLPEDFGGVRNWDYRYVWLRDASLTLEALIDHGFIDEAVQWQRWLLRAIAGDPADVQIMYGLAGERDLVERELDSLPGYDGAAPVRIGNGAVDQYQADVMGEVMVGLEAARVAGVAEDEFSWPLQRALLDYVEAHIDRPDNGIWEMRGEPRMFTYSRVMMWAAFDRGVRAVREHGLDGPVERWVQLRDRVRAEIDEHGYDAGRGFFVQSYGSAEVDASLLLLPQVGFCAPDDPRMLGTVAEIEKRLMHDGLLHRYRTQTAVDGLPGDEHPFLACSFWLVAQYAATGRMPEAHLLMNKLCGLANDVGLLSEEYDVTLQRHAGNTPQALSHLALVRAADALNGTHGRAAHRRSIPTP